MRGTGQEWNHTEYTGESQAHGYGADFGKNKNWKNGYRGAVLKFAGVHIAQICGLMRMKEFTAHETPYA